MNSLVDPSFITPTGTVDAVSETVSEVIVDRKPMLTGD